MSRQKFLEHLFQQGFEVENFENFLVEAEGREQTGTHMIETVDNRWTSDVKKAHKQMDDQNENVDEARAIGGTGDLTQSTSVTPKEEMNKDELVKESQSGSQARNVTQQTASGTNMFKCQHCGQYSSIKN